MSHKIKYSQACFLLSAATLAQLPADEGMEVAFAGRSNAGKSSALNALTRSNLARTSKTPGRTQLINIFNIDEKHRLVDLPGYGYAKVPLAIKERWQRTLSQYLQSRQCLCGIVLLMDIRHPLKPFDVSMLEWAQHFQVHIHILLTKADKLSHGKAASILKEVKQNLSSYGDLISIQLFSAVTGIGLPELERKLSSWLRGEEKKTPAM